MKITLFLLVWLCAFTYPSFSRISGTEADPHTVSLLLHQWKLERQVYANQDPSGTDSVTVAGTKKDYIQFHKDGKAFISYQGHCDTLDYRIIGDQWLYIENTPYRILVLDENKLSLYQDERQDNGDYSKIRLELKR